MVCSNKVARRLPTESNSTPAMELAFSDIRIRRYTNKRGTEQNTHPKTHTVWLLLWLSYSFFPPPDVSFVLFDFEVTWFFCRRRDVFCVLFMCSDLFFSLALHILGFVSHSFIYLYYCLFLLNSLGVNIQSCLLVADGAISCTLHVHISQIPRTEVCCSTLRWTLAWGMSGGGGTRWGPVYITGDVSDAFKAAVTCRGAGRASSVT